MPKKLTTIGKAAAIIINIACLENIMDWLAMSYKFGSRPFEYYNAHKDEITLPEKQIQFMEKCILERLICYG